MGKSHSSSRLEFRWLKSYFLRYENNDKSWPVFFDSNRRFTGPRPEGGFGDKKETTANKSDDDDDFWGYAEEGADAHL